MSFVVVVVVIVEVVVVVVISVTIVALGIDVVEDLERLMFAGTCRGCCETIFTCTLGPIYLLQLLG